MHTKFKTPRDPSSGTHFSAVLCCFCVCDLHTSGCRTVIPLTSGVCPLVGEAGPEAREDFLEGRMEGSKGSWSWCLCTGRWVELGPQPFGGKTLDLRFFLCLLACFLLYKRNP